MLRPGDLACALRQRPVTGAVSQDPQTVYGPIDDVPIRILYQIEQAGAAKDGNQGDPRESHREGPDPRLSAALEW